MNLIEQLGGYELAKQVFDLVPKDGNSYTVTRDDTGASFHSGEIFKALLKYRRQHNIFEIGDYYVYLYEWDSDLDIVCKFNPSEWSDHLWNIKNMIRHATPEEIKTGRRLPVIESDYCSDIRNHISPNTKVIEG